MNKRQLRAEEQLRLANSYNRADLIVDLFDCKHPKRLQLLGEEWSGCDRYPDLMRTLLLNLPCPGLEIMTEEEGHYLRKLPRRIRVWRGCYDHNRNGFSWTQNRGVAEQFPLLERYRHEEKSPILLEGIVDTKDILFVKLDRKELEIVPRPATVEIIATLE